MTFQQAGQPPGFGSTPAALGRQAEFVDMPPRRRTSKETPAKLAFRRIHESLPK
jgi:hypothetical protein